MAITNELKAGMAAERTALVALELLRIEDPLLSPYILLVNNIEDQEHQAETYIACPFIIARGGEGGAPSTSTINIIDLDQSILSALEGLPPVQEQSAKTLVRFILISATDPNFRQLEELYELQSYEVSDDCVIVMTVLSDPYMSVEIPAHSFTPDLFPGLFPTIEGE